MDVLEARGGYKISQWRVYGPFTSVQVTEGLWAKTREERYATEASCSPGVPLASGLLSKRCGVHCTADEG